MADESLKELLRSVANRIYKNVIRTQGGCWEWQRRRTPTNYGQITIKGHPFLAHRVSWMIHNGPIPPKKIICHTCDNPPCVNPEHLFLGTHQDNHDDMISKGRARYTKYTDEEILEAMRQILSAGFLPTMRSIMRKTGIESTATVSDRLQKLVGKGALRRFKHDQGYTFLPADFCVNPAHSAKG